MHNLHATRALLAGRFLGRKPTERPLVEFRVVEKRRRPAVPLTR